jgi:hypothetical protein
MSKIYTFADAEILAKKMGITPGRAMALLSDEKPASAQSRVMTSPVVSSAAPDTEAGPSLADAARQLSDKTGMSLADAQAQVYASSREADARAGIQAPGITASNGAGDARYDMSVAELARGLQAANPSLSTEECQRLAAQVAAGLRKKAA